VKDLGLESELDLAYHRRHAEEDRGGFQGLEAQGFPHNLLLHDVLIQEDRVLKAIER